MDSTDREPILSILIAAYNMERYLAKPLASLKGIDGIEIIVINDGSTDATSILAHEWAKDHANVVVIDKPNGHYGSAINAGLAVAKGTYVRILDADDAFDPAGLRSFVRQLADAAPVDAWVTDVAVVDEAETVRETWSFDLPTDGPFGLDAVARATHTLVMHALTYRTAFLRAIAYRQTEGIAYTDNDWIAYPLLTAQTFRYLPRVVYRYTRGRAGQSMARAARSRNAEAFEIIWTRLAAVVEARTGELSSEALCVVQRHLLALARQQIETLFFFSTYRVLCTKLPPFWMKLEQAAVNDVPSSFARQVETRAVVFSSLPLLHGVRYLLWWRRLRPLGCGWVWWVCVRVFECLSRRVFECLSL